MLYRILISIKTTIFLLFILSIFFVIGTIFPQGIKLSEYIKEGGRYIFLVKYLNFLNIFNSPLFILFSILLFLNLVFCTYSRIKTKKRFERLLSLIYHLGFIICFLGIFISYVFSFTRDITLYPDKPEVISYSGFTKDKRFEIKLKKFISEYTQFPSFNYPKGILSRLAIFLGWNTNKLSYKISSNSYFPKDWKSSLEIYVDGKIVKEKTIEVNSPLKHEGLTFYQMGYEEKFDLYIKESKKSIKVKINTPFKINNNKYKLKDFKSGSLFRIDGKVENIHPFVKLVSISNKKNEIGTIMINKPFKINNFTIIIKGVEQGSILSYRYDPGIPFLWIGGILVIGGMWIRTFLYFYAYA
jgi:cytochrome c biogenesis protein ResB